MTKFILSLGCFLTLPNAWANPGNCSLVSGSFRTVAFECRYSRDGIIFYNDGYKDISLDYAERTNALTIVMNLSSSPYTLNFIADGRPQTGRPAYEGDKYTALCENNSIHARTVTSILKYPWIRDYTITSKGTMIYKESFEGDSFVRICEMDRF